jgi:hypothetical protein
VNRDGCGFGAGGDADVDNFLRATEADHNDIDAEGIA